MTAAEKRPEGKENIMLIRADGFSAAPALLLSAVTLAVLVLDIAVPAMSSRQYMVYPLLIKCAGLISLVCAAACMRERMNDGRLKADAPVICFTVFFVCIAVSTCINGFSRGAMLGVPYRYIGIFDTLSLFLAYMFCSSGISRERTGQGVLLVFAAVSDAVAAAFLLDFFMPFAEAFRDKNEPAGMFFHGNHYGYFLVMAVIISGGLCLQGEKKYRIFGALSFALNLFALAVNRSMGCIIAVLAVLIPAAVILCIKDRRLIAVFAAVIIAAAVILAIYGSQLVFDAYMIVKEASEIITGRGDALDGYGRWGLWLQTVELIRERPLFGYGCEGITAVLAETNVAANPHNEVMTYAAFYGIPAAVFYTAGAAASVIRGLRSGDHAAATSACAALAYLISSLFGVQMFYTAPFFFALLGLSCSPAKKY